MITLSIQKQLWSASGEMALNVDISIAKGSFVTLYGKSGAGKTSLLRIISGLMQPDSGRIVVNDVSWLDTSSGINLTPQKRKAGFLFQDYALFPNMTVRENLAFALEKGQDPAIIEELIVITELGALQHRKPNTLSGGQKQRVALARSLVQRPDVLMLDEPLSALDHDMRVKLQEYILKVHEAYALTTILVSHDIPEILKLSDQMFVLEDGAIIRHGTPTELLTRQEGSGKFQFVGEVITIEKQDVIYVVSIVIGKNIVRVVADASDVRDLNPGDKVMVASKAFNPVIQKL